MTDNYTYDVFGAVTAHTGASGQPFTLTGQQQDAGAARGLVYLRARTYDPALGRFVSQDPLPFDQRYGYASGNPANVTDPAGLWCHSLGSCAGDVVGGVSNAADKTLRTVGNAEWDALGNTYVQQCAVWGAAGGAATLTLAGAAAGCATGVVSTAWQRYGSDDPFSQCAIWGLGAAVGAGGSELAAGAGCGAGALSWIDNNLGPGTSPTECAIWGAGAAIAAKSAPTRLFGGFFSCAAGVFTAHANRPESSGVPGSRG